MTRLIITNDFSSGGCLKGARLADRVTTLGSWLISGPLPTDAETALFFGPQEGVQYTGWPWRHGPCWNHRFSKQDFGLLDFCKTFETVELWFDPLPNDQLALVHFLDYARQDADVIQRLLVVQLDVTLRGCSSSTAAALQPVRARVTETDLQTASRIWTAWRQPTPIDIATLAQGEHPEFPFLSAGLSELLEDLPAVDTGLSATEMTLLQLVGKNSSTFAQVMTDYHQAKKTPLYQGFEAGEMLADLCHCPEPAVLGLPPGPFNVALMEDRDRYRAYAESVLTLSSLGHVLLARRTDFAKHNPIHRWWGNTELTNERLWRWNATVGKLIAPA